ncbi:hypothetical protein ACFFHF_23195 [Robertmurraya beringensis]|uniref:DUF2157 domain-containing protein n=1 Tax=Robertmurraya beringensis TaxID=641660 RepID=A0ABV6KXM1_9BACI
MDSVTKEQRKQIFREELNLLKKEQHISYAIYDKVYEAYEKFNYISIHKETLKEKETTPVNIVNAKPEKKKVVRENKKKTPEQLRERNITWLLNLGVILLLIGGLYVATSNWETMSSWMKASSIGLVACLFYGMAYISKRILHINQTAFAFTVLGSLFLPIFLLSLGWFQLLGSYFSYTGEGRYFLGMLSGYILVPIYLLLAKKISSRLFVWFAGVATTIGTAFFLTALPIQRDGFYFGMILYHAGLLLVHFYMKKKPSFTWFTKEVLPFFQASLVLTTAFMLLLFDHPVFYGMNIIFTAVLYLSMVFVTGHKNYHFVFTLFLVYGLYQLVENSILLTVGPIMYALVGSFLLGMPLFLQGGVDWKKIFSLTSAVVSLIAFVYISAKAFLVNLGDPTMVMMISYLILAGNFYYLALSEKKQWFTYVTSSFLVAALFELMMLVNKVALFDSFLPLFFIGFFLFVVFGVTVPSLIRQSSRDVGMGVMVLPLLPSWLMYDWWETGVMFGLLALCFILGRKVEERSFYLEMITWVIPICYGLSTAAMFEEGKEWFDWSKEEVGPALNFIAGSVLLLLIEKTKRPAFFISQAFYLIGILYSFSLPVNDFIRVFILSGGMAISYLLYQQTKQKTVTYYVTLCSLISYITLVYAIHESSRFPLWLEEEQWVIGGAILIIVSYVLRRHEMELSTSFLYTAHVYLPAALLLTFFAFNNDGIWSFVIATLLYGLSVKLVSKEWILKTLLYGCYISLFVAISLYLIESGWSEYSFFVTSIVLAIWWGVSTKVWKERSTLFLIPFSMIGMLSMLTSYPFGGSMYLCLLLYGVGVLFLLHQQKWDFLVILPLMVMLAGSIQFSYVSTLLDTEGTMVLFAGLGLLSLFAGKKIYKGLTLLNAHMPFRYCDAYTVTAFLYVLFLYTVEPVGILLGILPGILICIFLWMQQPRVSPKLAWIPKFLAGSYLLEPYYQVLDLLTIPALFERELYVLPFIVLGIYLERCLKGAYSTLIQRIQWGILIGVALLLVQDGLQSNTVYDAIIVGTLSLLSILTGTILRIKSYFFVGSGVLLLNVVLQTRPYWGNLPWWAYLLLAGSLLISVASYNEWNKQKRAKGEIPKLEEIRRKVLLRLKTWK